MVYSTSTPGWFKGVGRLVQMLLRSLRKGSEPTETIPGFVRHLRALLLSLRLGGGLPLFTLLPRRRILGNPYTAGRILIR